MPMVSRMKSVAKGSAQGADALRILLVDDRRSALLTTKFRFAQLGIQTASFDDESAALEAFAERPHEFDAIVASLAMRRVRGDAFAKRAWSIAPDIPITLLSGLSMEEPQEEAPTQTDVWTVACDAPLDEILLSLESQGLRVPCAVREARASNSAALSKGFAA